jgi:hypothetical protein
MRLDASLAFVPLGSPLSIVGATGATFYGPGIVDFLGTGVGTAPQAIIGTPSVYGQADAMGVGKDRIEMAVAVGTAFATSDSATLTIQMQGAPDTGSTGGYLPGTWQVFDQSPAMTATQLTANTVVYRFPWLPPFPFSERPRFLRMAFVTASGTQFTTGTIAYAIPSTGRDDWSAAYAAKNYTIA